MIRSSASLTPLRSSAIKLSPAPNRGESAPQTSSTWIHGRSSTALIRAVMPRLAVISGPLRLTPGTRPNSAASLRSASVHTATGPRPPGPAVSPGGTGALPGVGAPRATGLGGRQSRADLGHVGAAPVHGHAEAQLLRLDQPDSVFEIELNVGHLDPALSFVHGVVQHVVEVRHEEGVVVLPHLLTDAVQPALELIDQLGYAWQPVEPPVAAGDEGLQDHVEGLELEHR